jgi:hypothetical protein
MKLKASTSLLVVLIVAACASPTAVIDTHVFRCEPGQDISIAAGFDPGTSQESFGQELFLVEISNNSNADVTVKSISIEPAELNRVRMDQVYQAFDVSIPDGGDHVFRLPARGAIQQNAVRDLAPERVRTDFSVTVALANGDRYVCPFRVETR